MRSDEPSRGQADRGQAGRHQSRPDAGQTGARARHVGLVSGGSGGHLWPALALAEALRDAGHRTSLLTEGRQVEQSLLGRVGCEAVLLPSSDSAGRVRRLASIPRATLAARRILRERGIDVVVGTGGGACVAVGLAARSLGLPLCLLEQNAVLGQANRVLAPFARRLYLGLPLDPAPRGHEAKPQGRRRFTGTPIRREFGALDRAVARRRLGLAEGLPTIVVTGGSQGAAVINEVVPAAICQRNRPVQVVHLSGEGKDEAVRPAYERGADCGVEAVVRPLATDMPALFAAADLVICRGGGCTVSELIAAGRAAVVVPYPYHADQQQLRNARLLERAAAAVLIEQKDFTVARLQGHLERLFEDVELLHAMGGRARTIAPIDAANSIVHDLDEVLVR